MPLIKKQRRYALGGLMSGIGSAINQVLPPLAMNYIAVKKAEGPDFATVKRKTQEESEESASELEKELNKQFDEIIGKADMIRYDKDLFKSQKDQVMSHVKQNLIKDPYYFANNVNRQDLRQRVSDIMDSGVVQKAVDRKKLVDDHIKKINDKQVQETYVRDGDRRLQGMTKSEYANTLLSKSGDDVARLLGANANNIWGNLYLDNRVGSVKDAHDEVDKVGALVNTSTQSGSTSWMGNLEYEGKKYLADMTKKGSVTSNLDPLKHAKEYYAQNWRRALSPEAIHGYETSFEKEFDRYKYDGPVVTAGGNELIKPGLSTQEAQSRALQLQRVAQQRGDEALGEQAKQVLIDLDKKREDHINKQAEDDIRTRLGLRAIHSVEQLTDEKVNMAATTAKDEAADMAFNNLVHNGAGSLEWTPGNAVSSTDPTKLLPTQTTSIPIAQQAPYTDRINRKVLDEDGKSIMKPTSLSEMGNRLVNVDGRWIPASKFLNAANFKLTGGGTQAVRIHENEKEFNRSETEIAAYAKEKDKETDPAKKELLQRIIDLERATQKQRTGIKYIVTADSNDFQKNSAHGGVLSYKGKDGRMHGAVEQDATFTDQIKADAPFRIYKDDANAFAVDENWGIDHPYSLEIILEEPNISYNDDNGINKKYNIALGEEKKALMAAKNDLRLMKTLQADHR